MRIEDYFCRMQVDYLIIGQGLSGTWLSWYLTKENRSFIVIDKNDPTTPSKVSAGIINAVVVNNEDFEFRFIKCLLVQTFNRADDVIGTVV